MRLEQHRRVRDALQRGALVGDIICLCNFGGRRFATDERGGVQREGLSPKSWLCGQWHVVFWQYLSMSHQFASAELVY